MNKIIWVTALVCNIAGNCFSQSLDSVNEKYKGIRFEQDLSWEQVKAKALTENKYIFVDVYATWCGPCKSMEKVIYPDERVGDAVNNRFIPVKVQMDSAQKDDEQVRKWYADAHRLAEEYKIPGYPCYLFFTPGGKLVHQDVGFKGVGDFIRMTNLAIDPRKAKYYVQLEDYKKGKKDYPTMGGLAEFTQKLIGDRVLANTMAIDYKNAYLDKLIEAEVCTRENLDFIGEFYNLINSKDKFFYLCYHQPDRIDQIKDFKGWAKFQVDQTITREEIENKVLKNGKLITTHPDWMKIQSTIAKKYEVVDAKYLVLTYKIGYYHNSFVDWSLWAKYKNEMIKNYPPTIPYGLQIYAGINMDGAWDAFLHCPDPAVLIKALDWIDMALKLDQENRRDYLDTKANLLYKLGRKGEALSVEKDALDLTPSDQVIVDTYKKMQAGEPTWPPLQTVLQNK